jgi:hypothetical protein
MYPALHVTPFYAKMHVENLWPEYACGVYVEARLILESLTASWLRLEVDQQHAMATCF